MTLSLFVSPHYQLAWKHRGHRLSPLLYHRCHYCKRIVFDVFCVTCVRMLCSSCYWQVGCLLSRLVNKNWSEVLRFWLISVYLIILVLIVTFFRSGRNMAKKQLLASSYPFVRPYLRPHGTTRLPLYGFSWNLSIFRKSVVKIQVLLKSDKGNVHFTCRRVYVHDSISQNSSQNGKCFRQKL
jgi:hypothetical protein